ncbi:MFS transporter [Arthrobacter crystallopoietes]|uniref:Predicted arabinose efflux permease, MFS family n=1 Tax=Crystallibacter crystallopoietes TaxID=37928 RepID=A0A1H1CT47_9MICC|nr:MFS transporter [Arthrobacter crystallopoietes]AUI50618.1 MFS transporter [Arthrobacter crystallopoietes]SDQ67199.1 Predicted arabinose efflux permease, MFS family [Arthrobacter crystallopoietes]
MLAVLGNRIYRKLFAAQVVALAGTGLLTVALGLLAYDLADGMAGAVLGTALTIKMLAYVGIAPVVAALVERLPKKAVLVGADAVRAAMALCLPFITEVWQIYVLVFLLQAASATFTPAFQSLIPAVLPREQDYTRALSLSRLAYDLESLLSPALAALLLTLISYQNLFVGTAAGFVFSALMVVGCRLPAPAAAPVEGSLWHRTTLGARIFRATPTLRSLLALNLVVACGTAMVLVNSVVYVRDLYGRPDTDLALALAAYGAGSMLIALLAPQVLDRVGDRTLMLTGALVLPAGLLVATGITALGNVGGGWWVLLGLWLVMGAGNSMVLTPSARLLRSAATDSTRSYVFTAQFSLSHACFILTYPLAGWAGAGIGLTAACAALAILAIMAAVAAWKAWPADAAAFVPSMKAVS